MGVLEVLNKKDGPGFTDDDLEILTMLGNMIGPCLGKCPALHPTERKTHPHQEELKVVEEKLLQSERLAALGKLSQGVAHEVRNPVMIIGGFARTASQQAPVRQRSGPGNDRPYPPTGSTGWSRWWPRSRPSRS